MHKFYLNTITILLLFFFNFAYGAEIKIDGNDRFSKETIKVYGEIQDKDTYSREEVNEILKRLYETNFFEEVKISFLNNVLKIDVKEYPLINTLEIQGEQAKKYKEVIFDTLMSKEKGAFVKNNISQDIATIKNIYESLGFNFVEVDAQIFELSDNRVNLVFDVNKGNKLKISNIYFIGDKKVKEKRLRDVIVSEENKFWKVLSKNVNLNQSSIELDKRLLKNYYKSTGYYDVKIISTSAVIQDKKTASITYNINAGDRYIISKITTNLDPNLKNSAFLPMSKEYSKIIGDYYSPFKVKNLLDSLDILIDDNDLQFIEHSVNEITSDSEIEVVINIFEGEKSLVERVNVNGNTVTNESVIRSALLLDEGDPFNKLKLSRSVSELKAKNIFASVKENVENGSNEQSKIINITVEEKPTGEISAGAGVGTDGGLLSFSISENNWLGQGVKLKTFAELNANTFKGGIQINNPNYKFSGNALNFNIESSTNDFPDSGYENNVNAIGVGTGFEQYKDIYLNLNLNASTDKLTVLSSASDSLKKQAGTFSDIRGSYSLRLDKRDRSYMPTKGYVSRFGQGIPLIGDAAALENNYQLSVYNAFGENVIGSFKFYGATIHGLSDDVRLSRRIMIPQARLRGFDKVGPKDKLDYVGGNYASAVNFEASLPNLLPEYTKTDVSLFLDAGNVWGVDYDGAVEDSNEIRSSLGAAASWLSPLGPMTFVLAQNISKANTDKTQTFKFQLGTTF